MAKTDITAFVAAFTGLFKFENGRLSILLGVSVKPGRDGSIPEPKLKCPGGCLEECDIDAVEARLGNLKKLSPRVVDEAICTENASRELFLETGNKLEDIAVFHTLTKFSTRLRNNKKQAWQWAIIDPANYDPSLFRKESTEMLPFEWSYAEHILLGFARGIKVNPVHQVAIIRMLHEIEQFLIVRIEKAQGEGNMPVVATLGELLEVLREEVTYGLRATHRSLVDYANHIDGLILSRQI